MARKAFGKMLCETGGDAGRRWGGHRAEEDEELGGMSRKTTTQHKWLQLFSIIIPFADSNCSFCAFSVERESEEWCREELQISKAILHFPSR